MSGKLVQGSNQYEKKIFCKNCKGSGKYSGKSCTKCNKQGYKITTINQKKVAVKNAEARCAAIMAEANNTISFPAAAKYQKKKVGGKSTPKSKPKKKTKSKSKKK